MRKLYIYGPVGVGSLRTAYGYRAKIGDKTRPERTRKAGGAIIRKALQQLEASGYVVKVNGKGRIISSEGMKKLDRLATELHKELIKAAPQLQRYA